MEDIRRVSLTTAGNTMGWGGLVFMAGGLFGLTFPGVAGLSLATGLHVHNLDHLGIAIVLVMVTVLVIGVGTLVREFHRAGQAHHGGSGLPGLGAPSSS